MQTNNSTAKKTFLIFSWALYDLANQFFVLNIVSLYFVRWLTFTKKQPEILYSLAFGISIVLVAISAPVLGMASDISKKRRPFLIYFTVLAVIFTMLLGISDNVILALIFFMIANYGSHVAVVFYNALMANIAPQGKLGLISGFGRMFGYIGAILALYLIRPVVIKSGYQATFFPTGLLFLIFALPCMLFVKDVPSTDKFKLLSLFKKDKLLQVFRTLKNTAYDVQKYPGLLDFLKAAFFTLCGVNVVILFMSIYASRVFGLDETQVINLITVSTFFAIAGSIFSGYISDYLGYRRSLAIIIALWSICFAAGAFARQVYLFWAIGALTGVSLGATWAVARALAIRLVPQEKVGEVFGLFNFVGYVSGIVGPVFWGIMVYFLSGLGEYGYRIAMLSLVIFMALGMVFLLRIPKKL